MQETKLDHILARRGSQKRIKYSLERLKAALLSLGNPQENVHSLVIGGTNGKGTTALFVSSALALDGFQVATFLSPHLQSPTERLLLNLEPVQEAELVALAEEAEPAADRFSLTYFEFLALLAFLWARKNHVDFLVLEVGLGGSLDATNLANPVISAITNVTLDHTEILGDTTAAILTDKLGIVRPEGLLFTGIRDPELLQMVEDRCQELDAIYYYSKEIQRTVEARGWWGQQITLNRHPFLLQHPDPGTVENAALAFLLMQIAFPRIPIATLQTAFSLVRNPARLETVATSPRIVISGDHNPAGIQNLAKTLKEFGVKPRILCAFSPDKPHKEMYGTLEAAASQILLTRIPGGEVTEAYRNLGNYIEDPFEALKQIQKGMDEDEVLVITGSLYLAGPMRQLWHESVRFSADPPAVPEAVALASPGRFQGKAKGRSPAPQDEGGVQ